MFRRTQKSQATNGRPDRRGVVTVEFALSAPILFIIVLSGWEFSRINMIRNTADNAAYEGARVGMLPGSTAERAKETAKKALNAVGVNDATVTVDPPVIASDTNVVKVSISVPFASNSYGMVRFFASGNLEKHCTLSREIVFTQ